MQKVASPSSPLRSLINGVWLHRWFVLTVLVIAVSGAIALLRLFLGPEVIVDQVKRGNLVKTVVASGHFETPFRVEIGSQMTGVVTEVLVDEGEAVKAGQELIHLDAREIKAAVVQSQGALAQAEARLRQLNELTLPAARETLAQAKASLVDAQSTYDRTSSLFKNGFSPNSALDEAQKNLDVAKAQVRSAELQVFTASPGGSDYVVAETQVNQALANLEAAQSRLAYTVITAPRDGILINRSVEKGSVVQAGKPLLVLAPNGISQLVIGVDERNLGLIALGQSALASADAFPDQKFEGKVSYINPSVDITRASVEVKLDVTEPPSFLRQDMTVSVDIEVGRRNDVTVIGTRYLHDLQTDTPWVLTVSNGRAAKRNVKLGLRGLNDAEIIDGLTMGDKIIPPLSGVVSGQRIRAIMP
ncbi:MAG: efflux RND transporter periplasmic adaptor subunit [Beijerinckiaceae bacterium]|nr:efflux RND transporter periplasmic adaptor subunit [Beijerinckiaceae bacterium]